MHHFWPTGLFFTLILSLTGCVEQTDVETSRQQPSRCADNSVHGCTAEIPSTDNSRRHGSSEPEPVDMTYRVSHEILNSRSQKFVSHAGVGKYESYLSQNIPFQPTEDLRSRIERHYNVSLKHRGEAHITIVTPPEFERLSSHVSIDAVNRLASETVQNMSYELVCVGRGQTLADDIVMSTFFIVVKPDDINALREQIAAAYRQAGGPEPAFETPYHPHITIGFTHRDLYDSDGVIKNDASCVGAIKTTHTTD